MSVLSGDEEGRKQNMVEQTMTILLRNNQRFISAETSPYYTQCWSFIGLRCHTRRDI